MRSRIETPPEYREKVMALAQAEPAYQGAVPTRFIRLLEDNHGTADEFDANGLMRRNPLIVALGDSVTLGAFEGSQGLPDEMIRDYCDGQIIEHVYDLEHVYHEQFRLLLGSRYPRTAPSVINSGIGGDNVTGMYRRLERDVLRYAPDLVIINASLNGPGDLDVYTQHLRAIVERIRSDTQADLILMTPNMMIPEFARSEGGGVLEDRVTAIRSLAAEQDLPLADAYAIWQQFEPNGIELKAMLSNRINHPTILGHQVYAMELMKLFGG